MEKFGDFLRKSFLLHHQIRYKALREIHAPTIICWSERKLIKKWKNNKNPVSGFNKFKDVLVTGVVDNTLPKKKALLAFQTSEGNWIHFKKGRYGFYLEESLI
jgi:hypothetical protein